MMIRLNMLKDKVIWQGRNYFGCGRRERIFVIFIYSSSQSTHVSGWGLFHSIVPVFGFQVFPHCFSVWLLVGTAAPITFYVEYSYSRGGYLERWAFRTETFKWLLVFRYSIFRHLLSFLSSFSPSPFNFFLHPPLFLLEKHRVTILSETTSPLQGFAVLKHLPNFLRTDFYASQKCPVTCLRSGNVLLLIRHSFKTAERTASLCCFSVSSRWGHQTYYRIVLLKEREKAHL